MMKPFEIYVYFKGIEAENGKKFKAYEATDTKDKTRLSVALLLGADPTPEKSWRIKVTPTRTVGTTTYPYFSFLKYTGTTTQKQVTTFLHSRLIDFIKNYKYLIEGYKVALKRARNKGYRGEMRKKQGVMNDETL